MSKAYVIKNKEGKYWSTSFDYEGKPLLTDDIVDAMPYDDVDIQMVKCPKDCEVVEITIAEGDLDHKISVLEKAVELASRKIKFMYMQEVGDYIDEVVDVSTTEMDYLIQQAEQELKGGKE